ncbi:MAG: 4Fe-4S dicluster domain-containing protein [Candidatus Anammoxibacter sp.]
MIEKIKTFKGGYNFGNLQGMPKAKVRHVGIPAQVVVPLKQGYGCELKPAVGVGDKVKAGQIIAIDDNSISSPIHATVNGTVIDCEKRISDIGKDRPQIHISASVKSANRDENIGTVTIESDGSNGWLSISKIVPEIDLTKPEGVFMTLYMSGVSSLGTAGIPTPFNSSPIGPDKVKNIIIDGTNSEPFSLPVSAILQKDYRAFIIGLSILNFMYPDAEMDIGMDSDKKEALYGLYNALNSGEEYTKKGTYVTGKLLNNLLIHPLKPKYPQCDEAVLVETILGKVPVAKGEFAAIDYGVVIIRVEDVISIYEAVVEGKPLIETVVSLGGVGFNVNHGVSVRIGTSIKSVIAHRHRYGIESRFILNSIMSGEVINELDIPISRSMKSIIAIRENRNQEFQTFLRPGVDRGSFSNTFLSSIFRKVARRNDTNVNGELRPCIACNYCEYACPVNIFPSLISKYVTHDMAEEAQGLNIFNCIECGLCSYVCPSKIPVLQHIQKGKQEIRSEIEESEGENEAA